MWKHAEMWKYYIDTYLCFLSAKTCIEVQTIWLTFCRQHFEMHFRERKKCILILISQKIVSEGTVDWQVSIGSGNGLATKWKWATPWAYSESVHCTMMYMSPGVWVTKPVSSLLLLSKFFSIVKTHISCWISHLCLTGVTTAELQWHLSNTNVIHII